VLLKAFPLHREGLQPGRDATDGADNLLERARQGDAEAFCELCRGHEARLFRQAVAISGDLSWAEDLAQETLVAAWRSIQRFRGQCSFFTWLCSILFHVQANARRKQRPASFSSLSTGDSREAEHRLHNVAEDGFDPAEQFQQHERDAMLRACLERLPAKHRDVVYLRFHVDSSLDEIAAALGCSLGTVKSRLFHALEKLAAMPELKRITADQEPP
jgi:RNA polymerase sigma-70 factor, ECF subfamily